MILFVLSLAFAAGAQAQDVAPTCAPQPVVQIATAPGEAAATGGLACGSSFLAPAETRAQAVQPPAPAGTIDTVAGGGIGDGGPAKDAVVFLPKYETFDAAGNLYVSTQERVLKITPAGIVTTFAGTGTISYQGFHIYYGDGGPATAATFGNGGPEGLAFGPDGSLYIADTGDDVIRKVSPSGIITTVAGGGPTNNYGIEGDNPRAVALWAPDGIDVDTHGNLFIADAGDCTVREVKAADGKIYTLAGIPSQSPALTRPALCTYTADGVPALGSALHDPEDVQVDAAGNVYIADLGNSRIRMIDTLGLIHTVAGTGDPVDSGDGGPASAAGVTTPWHISLMPSGDLYIAEYFNHVIRKIDAAGTITRVAGSGTEGFAGDGGPAGQANLSYPLYATAGPDGAVYVADFGNNRIRKVAGGTIATVAGNGDPPHTGNQYYGNGFAGEGLPARSASLSGPFGLAVDRSGNLYIADAGNNRVRRVDAKTGTIRTFAQVPAPGALTFDSKGRLLVTSYATVRRIDSRGATTVVAGTGNASSPPGDGGLATSAGLVATGIAVDRGGNLYIADLAHQSVRKVDSKGKISTLVAGLSGPHELAVDPAGNLYVADSGNGRILKVTPQGTTTTVAGNGAGGYDGDGGQATATSLSYPIGVAIDAAGNLLVTDTNNCFVRQVDAGTGRIHILAGVPLAYTTTSPGFLNCDFNGDGGPATQAHLFLPTGITVDRSGNVLFSDAANARVRKIVR